jgi:hypothetical protein
MSDNVITVVVIIGIFVGLPVALLRNEEAKYAFETNRRVRGFHHMRRQCGSLSSSNRHFLPCSKPLLFLAVSYCDECRR